MKRKFRKIKYILAIVVLMIAIATAFIFFNAKSEITFAHLTDIHIPEYGRGTTQQELLLKDAITEINKVPDLNFTLISGDIVNSPDKELTKYIFGILNTLNKPWYYSLGNHDCISWGYMPKNEFIEILKKENPNFKFEKETYTFKPKKGFTVIAVDSTQPGSENAWNGHISKEALELLDKTLSKNKKDTIIIFMHIPLMPPVDNMPYYAFDNPEEFYAVLNKYKQPIIILGGHYHATSIKRRDNVIHVGSPSLAYCQEYRIINVKNSFNKTIVNFEYKETTLPGRFDGSRGHGEESDKNISIEIKR